MTDSQTPTRPPYTVVIVGLILYSLAALVGIIALTWAGKEAPESLIATLGMSVGALAGVVATK